VPQEFDVVCLGGGVAGEAIAVGSSQVSTEQPRGTRVPFATTVDLKLEVIAIPVSDVDRARAFYAG
jgi:hypothetical protein